MESVNLNNLQDFNLQYGKPTLWVYGGHPLVPSSGRIFYKIQEILAFSAVVWPRKNLLKEHLGGNFSVHIVDQSIKKSSMPTYHPDFLITFCCLQINYN